MQLDACTFSLLSSRVRATAANTRLLFKGGFLDILAWTETMTTVIILIISVVLDKRLSVKFRQLNKHDLISKRTLLLSSTAGKHDLLATRRVKAADARYKSTDRVVHQPSSPSPINFAFCLLDRTMYPKVYTVLAAYS